MVQGVVYIICYLLGPDDRLTARRRCRLYHLALDDNLSGAAAADRLLTRGGCLDNLARLAASLDQDMARLPLDDNMLLLTGLADGGSVAAAARNNNLLLAAG